MKAHSITFLTNTNHHYQITNQTVLTIKCVMTLMSLQLNAWWLWWDYLMLCTLCVDELFSTLSCRALINLKSHWLHKLLQQKDVCQSNSADEKYCCLGLGIIMRTNWILNVNKQNKNICANVQLFHRMHFGGTEQSGKCLFWASYRRGYLLLIG